MGYRCVYIRIEARKDGLEEAGGVHAPLEYSSALDERFDLHVIYGSRRNVCW